MPAAAPPGVANGASLFFFFGSGSVFIEFAGICFAEDWRLVSLSARCECKRGFARFAPDLLCVFRRKVFGSSEAPVEKALRAYSFRLEDWLLYKMTGCIVANSLIMMHSHFIALDFLIQRTKMRKCYYVESRVRFRLFSFLSNHSAIMTLLWNSNSPLCAMQVLI